MDDVTRSEPNGGWLSAVCTPDLQVRIRLSFELGEALGLLVQDWAQTASRLISEFEDGVPRHSVPDPVMDAAARAVGVLGLFAIGDTLIVAADRVARVDGG